MLDDWKSSAICRIGGGVSEITAGLSALGSWIVVKTGKIVPIFVVLFVVMILDYVSGMVKAGMTGKIDSARGFQGVRKKLMYGVMVVVALIADYVICFAGQEFGFADPGQAFFAMLVSFWLIINEGISILENLSEIGVPMPAFLVRAFERMKIKVEKVVEQEEENEVETCINRNKNETH